MSLASKIFWNTLLVLAIVLGVTGWWSIEDEREALGEILAKHGTSMAQSLAAFSVEALVSQDYPSLDKALQSIGRSADNIVHLKITQGNHTLAQFGQAGNGETFSAPVILSEEGLSTRTIGNVQVVLSKKDSLDIINSRISEQVINSLILFVTLALALHILIRRLVLKRLALLTRSTEGVIAERTPDLAGASAQTGDELDRLHARYATLLKGLEWRDQERSLALQKVQEAQALLNDVANSLPSSLIVLSRDGLIEYCNRAAGELADTAPHELAGKILATQFPPLAAQQEQITEVAHAQQPLELHRQFWSTATGQRIVNIAVYPLSTRAAGGLVIRIDDVTDRTRLEEVMIQSEKLASIGGLAAGIAHEINNPLGVMIQAAQNIERRVSDSIEANHRVAGEVGTDIATIRSYLDKRSILEFLNDIKSDGARAAKIVRSLLEFSRKSEPVLEACALPELLEHTLELARKDYDLKKKFDFRRIDVHIDLPDSLPPVQMIRSEIEQVLLNLLKNAAQAMGDKFGDERADEKPRIDIRVHLLNEFIEIEITDNGPGFSEEAKRRAFEPFFTTKAPGIGTGLGLWIAYMIITDKHHGQMLLESTPGHGASFVLRLPR